jgi:ribulose-phosphate 3-epimerase
MVNNIFNILNKQINFIFYRFRYLINYIIIGFFSILVELAIIQLIQNVNMFFFFRLVMGFVGGLLFSFFLNAKLNFKVPKDKNLRTFVIFSIISAFAFGLNLLLIKFFSGILVIKYSYLRLFTAGIIFLFSYTIHRKITFDFVKRVGLAVYLNKGEDVEKAFSKIKYYSDFIHVDLVDKSFNKDAREIDISLINEINKTKFLKKFLHIMSKNPSKWIKKLIKSIDVFLFHTNIDESIDDLINLCKSRRKKVGLVLTIDSDFDILKRYIHKIDFVQLMGINSLGESGKEFQINSLEMLKKLNNLKKFYNFDIIFDGGVKTTNINKINAKYIVSSSELLNSKSPKQAFMELKTSSKYISIDKKLKRTIFLGIRKTVESMDFVESGNIVGSFSEGKGLEGINDIDIVIVLDKLTKKKFNTVLDNFNKLKRDIESRYGYPVYINNTLGPLKFNCNCIVFHLMIYDIETHKKHCIQSPFTCFDWQRSKLFIKKPLYAVYRNWDLQLKDFFNSRRGIDEYLFEIKSNKLSYRVYEFKGNKVIEVKKYKEMNERDKIEFACHITRFLITNFLKIYYFKNKVLPLKEMMKEYFSIFTINSELHKKKIAYLFELKEEKEFIEVPWLIKWVELFIKDFEYQFKELFEIK